MDINRIESALQEPFYSPYRLARVVSSLVDREIPTQMMYGYVRAGRIGASLNSTKKIQIEREEALRFVTAYIERVEERERAEANKQALSEAKKSAK
jgi:hypothetical protein